MKSIYNYNELKGKIISKYGSQIKFSRAIKSNPQRVTNVLSGKAYLDVREVDVWRNALEIDTEHIPYYFFAH